MMYKKSYFSNTRKKVRNLFLSDPTVSKARQGKVGEPVIVEQLGIKLTTTDFERLRDGEELNDQVKVLRRTDTIHNRDQKRQCKHYFIYPFLTFLFFTFFLFADYQFLYGAGKSKSKRGNNRKIFQSFIDTSFKQITTFEDTLTCCSGAKWLKRMHDKLTYGMQYASLNS